MSDSKKPPLFEINASRQFTSWLREQGCSLAFSTYQTGKLFFLGTDHKGQMTVFQRTFERCMGLHTAGRNTLWMSSLYQLWRFENSMPDGDFSQDGYDALYVPQIGYTTGDLDIHDIASMDGETNDQPIFVNTLFSCLAQASETHSFKEYWRPPFLSKLAAEDRCHLNGLAMRDGKPRYVTMVSETDVHEGWREHRHEGGIVMDIESNEVVALGLSMPHSPRWHRDQLYIINSGTGEFGRIDLDSGDFEPIAFCPGFARGMAIHGDFAIVGLSKCRENRTFGGLELNDRLAKEKVQPRCGLQVIDLRSGDVAHTVSCEGIIEELYDVAVLEDVCNPSMIGFRNDEIRRVISIEN